jgi:hypothetical protein
MQDHGSKLRRIPLPRTRMNKGLLVPLLPIGGTTVAQPLQRLPVPEPREQHPDAQGGTRCRYASEHDGAYQEDGA